MHVVIVGGNALGASLAARLRRLNEEVQITIVEKKNYVSFANCGLPYFLSEIIPSKERLFVTPVEELKIKYNLEVLTECEMLSLEAKEKKIIVSHFGQLKEIYYDELVLAMGAKNNVPPIQGLEEVEYFALSSVEDAVELKENLKGKNKIAIVGAGFIGLEILDNIYDGRKEVHLYEASDRIANMDEDMSLIVSNALISSGVHLHLKSFASAVRKEDGKIVLKDNHGQEDKFDSLIIVTGVRPNIDSIKNSGLELVNDRFIKVDENLKTSLPHIYAGGDLILSKDLLSHSDVYVPLAGYANKDARIIANNIMGLKESRPQVLRTSIFKLFNLAVGRVGLSEDEVKKLGYKYQALYSLPFNHVSYYPGASRLMMKVIFKDDGLILGTTIISNVDVARKIDTLSALMRKGGTYKDLMDIDLSYSPAFGSAKDGLNMLGFMFDNIKRLDLKVIDPLSFYRNKDEYYILDVRARNDYAKFHFKNAINIPFGELRNNLDKLDKSKMIYVICYTGVSSYNSCRILMNHGFNCTNVLGGHTYLSLMNLMKN